MKLSTLSVGTRLTAGFGIVLAILIVLLLVTVSRLTVLHDNLEHVVKKNVVVIALVTDMRDAVRYQAAALRDVVMQDDVAFKQSELRQMKEARTRYQQLADKLKPMLRVTDQEMLAQINAVEVKLQPLMESVIDLSLYNEASRAAGLLRDSIRPEQLKLLGALDALHAQVQKEATEYAAEADAAYKGALLLMVLLGAGAVVAGIAIAFFITRSITAPLKKAVVVADAVAAGDLTAQIEAKGSDETARMLGSLKKMTESLQAMAYEVRHSAESIGTAAKEISAGNSDLSQRTEEQASSLEETASSMEELTSTVKQNADNSKQANQLATNASGVAIKGGDIVGRVVVTMDLINQSSQKIVDIIGVIEGIAFQTNILALNAAVEAARAGEQGRGFAVVAGEVRNLAQRSANAAKEIKGLIDDSVRTVSEGSKLVDEAGKTMEEILASSKRVADIIAEIAAASDEQSAGIEQVNQAIMQMDEVTQQNAALVEEAAAAAVALEDQAANLNRAVAVFKLPERVEGAAPVAALAPVAPVVAAPVAAAVATTTAAPARQRRSRKAKAQAVDEASAQAAHGDWREF